MRNRPQRAIPREDHRDAGLRRVSTDHPELKVQAAHAELAIGLWASASGVIRDYEAHFARFELSSARFGILMSLYTSPAGSLLPSELSLALNVKRPTITGIVRGLVAEGLVRRSAETPDRRSQPLELTREGVRLMRRVAPDHVRRLGDAVSRLSAEEQQTLRAAFALMHRIGEELSS